MRGFSFEARTSVPGVAPGDGVRLGMGALAVTSSSLDLRQCSRAERVPPQWVARSAPARKITGELEPVPVTVLERPARLGRSDGRRGSAGEQPWYGDWVGQPAATRGPLSIESNPCCASIPRIFPSH